MVDFIRTVRRTFLVSSKNYTLLCRIYFNSFSIFCSERYRGIVVRTEKGNVSNGGRSSEPFMASKSFLHFLEQHRTLWWRWKLNSYYCIACLTQLRQTEQFTSNHQYGLLNENIRFLRSHAKSLLYISKCLRNDFFFKSGPNEVWLDGNSDLQPQLSIHLRFSSLLESRSFISSRYTWTWPFLVCFPGKQFWIVLSPLNKSMITRQIK